jgi:hypothetical protein
MKFYLIVILAFILLGLCVLEKNANEKFDQHELHSQRNDLSTL